MLNAILNYCSGKTLKVARWEKTMCGIYSMCGLTCFWFTLLVAQVKLGVSKIVAELCAWSLKHSASGVAPKVGFYGEQFPTKTWRSEISGKPLALGYRTLAFFQEFFNLLLWGFVSFVFYAMHVVRNSTTEGNLLLLEIRSEGPHGGPQFWQVVRMHHVPFPIWECVHWFIPNLKWGTL